MKQIHRFPQITQISISDFVQSTILLTLEDPKQHPAENKVRNPHSEIRNTPSCDSLTRDEATRSRWLSRNWCTADARQQVVDANRAGLDWRS